MLISCIINYVIYFFMDINITIYITMYHIIIIGEVVSNLEQTKNVDEFNPRQLRWSDIYIDTNNPDKSIIGYGTFGVVVRGVLKSKQQDEPPREIAIKIFLQVFYFII